MIIMSLYITLRSKIREKLTITVRRENILLYSSLILIFLLGFLVRFFPFFKYDPLLRAYDPWYQYSVASYVSLHGYKAFFNWYDLTSWYPNGRFIPMSTYPGTPFTAATLYFILRAIGIHTDIFMVCYVFPAFMGALTCVALYFLGKEMANKNVGLLSAFFLVFCPAHISRTTAGFFDNEALGVLLTVLIFYFFVRTLKHNPIVNGTFAGLCLGYLGASWGAYLFALNLIPLSVLLLIIFRRFSYKLLQGYSLTILLGMLIIVRVPRTGIKILTGTSGLFPLLVLGLLGIIGLIEWFKVFFPDLNLRKVVVSTIPLITAGTITILYYLYKKDKLEILGGKFLSVVNPLERFAIIESVAEHIPITWGQLFFNFSVILIFFPVGLYCCIQRLRDIDLCVLVFGLTTLYFASSMVRLVLIFAPPSCLIAAFCVDTIISPYTRSLLNKKHSFKSKIKLVAILKGRINIAHVIPVDYSLLIVIFFISILGFNAYWGSRIAYEYFSTPDMILRGRTSEGEPVQFQDWQEAMMFLREMTPKDAIVASWWDYGYIINTVGNRTTVVDNATWNSTQIAWIGYALMSPPEEAARILKRYDVDYVLVHFTGAIGSSGGDEGKFVWMIRIAEEHFGQEVITESDYIDDRLGTPKEAYYNSLLYHLLYYQFSDAPEEHPVTSIPHSEHVYTTNYWLVRIYKVHY